jgi:hypothetical protein
MAIWRASVAVFVVVISTGAARTAEEKLVANPEFASWAKVEKGTLLKWSRQRVNVMDVARPVVYEVESIGDSEVVLADTYQINPAPRRKIAAKVLLFKAKPAEKTAERKLKDGSTITCKLVIRKTSGKPDLKLWLSEEVPGGIVELEWDDPKEGTIVEKLMGFKAPGKGWKEFEVPAPDPRSAHPIEPEAPKMPEPEKAKMDGGPTPAPDVPPEAPATK